MIQLKWIDFKKLIDTYSVAYNEIQTDGTYYLTVVANNITFHCELNKGTDIDTVDYETNYQASSTTEVRNNANLKPALVASSRPPGTKTTFTMSGDDATTVGAGAHAVWDFSNTDNDVTADTGRKKKQIDITFRDDIWIKEGCVYFHNAKKGTFCNMSVYCNAGNYIKMPDGSIVGPMPVDTLVANYVINHYIQGDAPMGDELNTEEAQENALPPGYFIRLEVDAPDTDTDSNGYVSFELYRENTL